MPTIDYTKNENTPNSFFFGTLFTIPSTFLYSIDFNRNNNYNFTRGEKQMARMIKVVFDILFSDGKKLSKEIIPLYLAFLFSDCPDETGAEAEDHAVDINQIYKICHIEFEMEIGPATTFRDVLERIFDASGIKKSVFFKITSPLYCGVDEGLVHILNYDYPVSEFIRFNDEVYSLSACLIFSKYQGEIYREDNISYSIHSNEQGHNIPHVHVKVLGKDDTASVSILDGKILAGKLRQDACKKAVRLIERKREMFIDGWRSCTNGLDIDIFINPSRQ